MKKSGIRLLFFCMIFLVSLIYSYLSGPMEDVKSATSESAIVGKVVDGDTITLSDGQKLRYIGIDTPETKDPRRPVGCFGEAAYLKNKELVEGKAITLEKDVSQTDKYGRLLRYVWVKDIFVNDYLVRNGYASAASFPPDIKYQGEFRDAEMYARENKLGLWGVCPVLP